jgi:glycosyltransferase involved in cell wall biosynthesis
VSASWIEGFGEPPLEAAGYGCAVIAPEQSAMPEMFSKNGEMLFCKSKDEECLYNSLKYLIDSEYNRKIIGKYARVRAAQYTFEKAFKEFEKAILE